MEKNERTSLSKDDSFLYNEEEIDPIFFHNIMTQKINKKLDIILPNEINQRKKIIYDLFKSKFGPNFIEKKPESFHHFELLLGKYFFSSKSKFLRKNFPKLHNQIFHEKKIDFEKLKSKINIGSMLYLQLRKHLVSNKSLINDKLFYISKNFTTTTKEEKDLVSNLYRKLKNNANKRKDKIYKSSNNIYTSKKSLNLSRINSNKTVSKIKDEKNNDNLEEIKENKKKVLNFISKDKDLKTITVDNDICSKTQKNFFRYKNKNVKFKNSLIKNNSNEKKISSKLLNKLPSSETYYDKYKNFYLSNPFYMYNSNIYNRNKNKYKKSQTGNITLTQDYIISPQTTTHSGNFTISKDNFFSPQISFKSKNSNLILNQKSSFFRSSTKSISPKTKTSSSIQNHDELNTKKDNNIKIITQNISNTINLNEDLKNNNELSMNNNIQENKNKKYYILKEKNSFDKYLKRKTKKYKKRINSEAKILNNYTNKCNKKLIKLIDKNFILNSKEKQKNKYKNVNFDITKLLLDDKIPKKVFIKYARNLNTIKPIFKKTVDDLTRFDKRNKSLGQKYFIKNINNIPTEMQLFFIGELFQTNHIKFGLKEYSRKREEQKLINEKKNLKLLRIKSKNHLFKIKQLEYNLSNKREAFFKKENDKIHNLKIFQKIHGNNNEIKKEKKYISN